MRHNVFQSDKFNFLTLTRVSEGLIITGETKEGLSEDDEIQNPNDGKLYMPIKEILERRDSKAYPEGNNYFYKVLC